MSFEDGNTRNIGIRVGRIRGVEVRIHWMLLVILLVQLLVNHMGRVRPPSPFSSWLVSSGALLFSILLHELGHCYAAFRLGGSAERVVLWPLGGLAYATAPQHPRAQFWLAAGGPLVNLALGLISAVVCIACRWDFLPYLMAGGDFRPLEAFFQFSVLWNTFLLLPNLIWCYPLDGGRMFLAIAWMKTGSYGQAVLRTLKVSRVTAVLSLIVGLLIFVYGIVDKDFALGSPLLWQLSWGLLLVALVFFHEGKALEERLAHGEEEDGIFGYDFSRGYTSLERTATRKAGRVTLVSALREKFRERARIQKREKEDEIRRRVDELLAKIHDDGMESLDREERRFLEKASRILRR
ncbi:MAG TPA: site-2 protease family protein [Planctomycetota bacterium]|nr:site-2 protease family protein [Planctomycetota bacterium]